MEMSAVATRVLANLLEAKTGQQLVASRRWRIETALRPFLRDDITSLDALAARLSVNRDPALADAVVEALLNNETFFFRDLPTYELLMNQAAARLAPARAAERRLRIWSAGCSTGQEVYSLAMGFAVREADWAGWTVEIVGTDISHSAIEQARHGLYSQFEIQRGLPIRLMMEWFDQEQEGQWRARPALRHRVSFHVHNLVGPPFPGRFDMVLCRNVMLYFASETRREVFDKIAQVIAPDGMLVLGAGETVLGQTDAFESDRDSRGLYRPTRALGQRAVA